MSEAGPGWTVAGLWLAVLASGLYHGLNPGMGWPLAVSAGLMERRARALWAAVGWLTIGHLLAMLVVLVPFAALAAVIAWRREIQLAAGLLVAGFGAVLLIWRRHPRMLARIRPAQLGLWSFAVALAHGAALMLVPIYLGLCRSVADDEGHAAAASLMGSSLDMALLVSVVHTTAMLVAGGLMAWLVYRYLGLKVLSQSWFNLEAIWSMSLLFVGSLSLVLTIAGAV